MPLQYKKASDHPQDWSGGINDYLQQHGIICDKITPFTGGVSCYLWRLDGLENLGLPTRKDLQKVELGVLKCADSIAKSVPLPVWAERLQLEIKALSSKPVAEACRQEPSVKVPSLLKETKNGYLMTWGGEIDLRAAYKENKSMDTAAIGTRLGTWLGALHLAGTEADKEGWSPQHDDVAKFAAPGGLEEQALWAAIEKSGSSKEDFEHTLRVMRHPSRIMTLTPWDFRPMNTLLHFEETGTTPDITIVDWEMAVYGDPVNDLRLWIAETMVMQAKFGNDHQQLLSPFLIAYRCKTEDAVVDEEFVCKLAIAVGVFLLIFIAAPIWECDEEEQKSWRATAVEYIQHGSKRDLAWLRKSVLSPLLEDRATLPEVKS